jgi:SAM-dependent methyltransferase
MRCPICSTEGGNWENVDEFRHKPEGMSLCNVCGFVTYPDRVKKGEELKEFYREEYRDVPTVQNIYSGQRKLHYHGNFLRPLFDRWKLEKKKPVVGEIGSAFGMFLDWFRKIYPGAQVFGTELTLSYRRVAKHFYGLDLAEDFDTSRKYDLICSYKVAEHMPDFDRELVKYREALAPGGHLYISVPCWFDIMHNFGAGGFSIEYYYHPNHINVWTRRVFEGLLARAGFEIVQQDHSMYDDTYLCKVNLEKQKEEPVYEDPKMVREALTRIKQASLAFDSSEFDRAVELWPNFPDAHVGRYETLRAKLHKAGWEAIQKDVIDRALEACPGNPALFVLAADLAMRYGKWQLAMDYLGKELELRPNDPQGLTLLGTCFRQMADATDDPADKVRFRTEARDVMKYLKTTSQQCQPEAITWELNDCAAIPLPSEAPHP